MNTTHASCKLPEVAAIAHLFTMLFGAGTTCTTRRKSLNASESAIIALYRDDCGHLKRVLVCDFAFANGAGAALTSIPPAIASKATQAGVIADNVIENLHEVMNVAVNLFTEGFGGRLELESVLKYGEMSDEIRSVLASECRIRIDVAIPRYELGRVDLVTID